MKTYVNPGYEGRNCEKEIDECKLFEPCVNGTCIDNIADYTCECSSGWGGKNCSVELTGCDKVVSWEIVTSYRVTHLDG